MEELLNQPAGTANTDISILVLEPNPQSFELLARNRNPSLVKILRQWSLIDDKRQLTSLSDVCKKEMKIM